MDLAARQLPPDALIFFTDVDVTFDGKFIERCSTIASKGQVVYYPIVFSQYDPDIIGNFSSGPRKPDLNTISKMSGHWVFYGFGMVCLYNQDYASVGGYNVNIRGWGGEDVALYDSHVKSDLQIWRSCEPGLVHRYHRRHCDPKLSPEQLRMCTGAAAESIGSRSQLANMIVSMEKKSRIGLWKNFSSFD